jgi:trehalose synthase
MLAKVVESDRMEALIAHGEQLRYLLDGASVVCVNSTASGGGVAEMLHVLLPYVRGVGIDARWFVIEGDERFFEITKRLHNHLYGDRGDGGPLGDAEHGHYESVLQDNAVQLAGVVRPGDVVVLHDPQPAGLASMMRQRGARVVWRCHVGTDSPSACTEQGWTYLRRYIEPPAAEAYVFSRRQFAPPWIPAELVHPITPSIDPFAPKNQELAPDEAEALLVSVGLLSGDRRGATYRRPDGTSRRVERGADIVRSGPPPDPGAPLVVQISRWDRLKDMVGVMKGFADFVVGDQRTHLVLAGPVVTSVADDPEGADILRACWEVWRSLPHHARSRIAIACLPMADAQENAIIVNALQCHATVVVQKSIAEGFGLTVAEAMFKRRTVLASAVGGIADQIVDSESGLLLADPADLGTFSRALASILADAPRRDAIGERARQRVIDRFLPDTQLACWSTLLAALVGETPAPAPERRSSCSSDTS